MTPPVTTPTAEELALAERIANEIGQQHSMSFVRWEQSRLAALAAIRETTERAIRHAYLNADMSAGSVDPCVQAAEATALMLATDFESGYHLKGEAHDA